ncbi:MAG TPA: chemotaxis protein CheW [Polyangiaceae bacterium]
MTSLLCTLGGELYGFDAACVDEVVRMPWVTAVAESPAEVRGVVDYRGSLVVVIDPALRLLGALRPMSVDAFLVVLRAGPDRVALVVDQVHGLRDAVPRPPADAFAAPPFVVGHIDDDDGNLVTLLDVPTLLREDVRELVVRTRSSQQVSS